MARRINYIWRLAGTGIAFAVLFFGGGVLAVTVLAVLAWFPGHRRERAQLVIHRAFRAYIASIQALGLVQLRIDRRDLLAAAQGRLIVANHPSLLDIVVLMATIPNAQCIVKHELWNHRFLGALVRAAGYIRNDLDGDAMIAACKDALARGNCLIIFPEGTRTIPGQPPRFHRGFANLAILTGAPVQPVIITCDPPTLIKGEPWWRIPPRAPLVRLTICECLDSNIYSKYPYRGLAARKLTRFLEAFYVEQLTHG